MVLLGCKPNGRHTEQHDIFFGIAETLKDLVPSIIESWPEAKGKIHIDAWREVNNVNGYSVQVLTKTDNANNNATKLFFLNLGGYKKNEFEEFHYKMIVACENKGIAVQKAKQTAFYKHTGFKEAPSHIDDKYGVDVDDVFEIEDILTDKITDTYSIVLTPDDSHKEDTMNLGYYILSDL